MGGVDLGALSLELQNGFTAPIAAALPRKARLCLISYYPVIGGFSFQKLVEANNETLSALLLVKERITAVSVAHLITEVSAVTPLYAGLKASYCVSANPTNPVVS